MTLGKVIEAFDKERANAVPLGMKIRWISSLDMKISSTLLEVRGGEKFGGYDETCSLQLQLKAPEEYAEIYGLYLNMKLDYLNGEIGRFNNSAMLFNRMFKEMSDFINRKTKVSKNIPVKAGKLYV